MQVPIGHAEEVEEVFDAISYCKERGIFGLVGSAFDQNLPLNEMHANYHPYDSLVHASFIREDLWCA